MKVINSILKILTWPVFIAVFALRYFLEAIKNGWGAAHDWYWYPED